MLTFFNSKIERVFLTIFLGVLTAVTSMQDCVAAEAEEKPEVISEQELKRRRESVPQIKERIADREAQLSKVVENMERTNAHMEERIDKVVSGLKSIRDSEDSRIRVAKLKEHTIEALYKTVDDYQRKRNTLKELVRSGKASVGESAAGKGIAAFDTKIEKRVSQIVELSKSFTEHKDYKKYELESPRNGWEQEYVRKNEKWKQDRRETKVTDQQHRHVIEGLNKNLEKLKGENTRLRIELEKKGLSETLKQFYTEDLERNEAALKSRRQYLDKMVALTNPVTKPVGQRRAHDIELMVKEVAEDIRKMSSSLKRDFYDVEKRLSELNKLRANFAARKEWLAKYDAGHNSGPK